MSYSFDLLQHALHLPGIHPERSCGLTIRSNGDDAKQAWERIANTAEVNIFILSLLLWKTGKTKNAANFTS